MPLKFRRVELISVWGDGCGSIVIQQTSDGKTINQIAFDVDQFKELCDQYEQLKQEAEVPEQLLHSSLSLEP